MGFAGAADALWERNSFVSRGINNELASVIHEAVDVSLYVPISAVWYLVHTHTNAYIYYTRCVIHNVRFQI